MSPDCPYCGFKDNAPHTCFPDAAIKAIDERIGWYHAEWQRAQDLEEKLAASQSRIEVLEQEVVAYCIHGCKVETTTNRKFEAELAKDGCCRKHRAAPVSDRYRCGWCAYEIISMTRPADGGKP